MYTFKLRCSAVLFMMFQQLQTVIAAVDGCGLPFDDVQFYYLPGSPDSKYFALSIDNSAINTNYIASARLLLEKISNTCQAFLTIDSNQDHHESICWQNIGRYYTSFFHESAAASATLLSGMDETNLGHDQNASEPWGCVNTQLNEGLVQGIPIWPFLVTGGCLAIALVMIYCCMSGKNKAINTTEIMPILTHEKSTVGITPPDEIRPPTEEVQQDKPPAYSNV